MQSVAFPEKKQSACCSNIFALLFAFLCENIFAACCFNIHFFDSLKMFLSLWCNFGAENTNLNSLVFNKFPWKSSKPS